MAAGPEALELKAGLVMVQLVELEQFTLVAGTDPPEPANLKLKDVGPSGLVNWDPVTAITVPPAGGPQFGEIEPPG